MAKRRAGFLIASKSGINRDSFGAVFSADIIRQIGTIYDLDPEPVLIDELGPDNPHVGAWEIIFCNWGFPVLSSEQLGYMPRLYHVFYAGGSIKHFAPVLLDSGIGVTSAKDINSLLVAEYCECLIYLALKGYFSSERGYRTHPAIRKRIITNSAFSGVGLGPVALIGFGAIGKLLAARLVHRGVKVLVVDPHAEPRTLDEYHVRAVDLETAVSTARVISNHLPDLDELNAYFSYPHFRAMQPYATFVNTGRGRQVDELALCDVFAERDDLTALLDVTVLDPLPLGNRLRCLDNVILTPHIAGCVGKDLEKLAEALINAARIYERDGYPASSHCVTNWSLTA